MHFISQDIDFWVKIVNYQNHSHTTATDKFYLFLFELRIWVRSGLLTLRWWGDHSASIRDPAPRQKNQQMNLMKETIKIFSFVR